MNNQCAGRRVWLQGSSIGLHRLRQVQRHLALTAKLQSRKSRLEDDIRLDLRRICD